MNSQQNSQDEGFIPTKLVPKVSEIEDIRDSKGKQCKTFSAFYLPAGQGAMRTQIPQAVEEIDQFLIQEEIQAQKRQNESQEIRKSIKRNFSSSVTPQHPYRFYEQNSAFQLVYSKKSSDEPLENEFQYIKNQIILQTADMKESNHGNDEKTTKVVNILRNPYSRLLRSSDANTVRNAMSRNFSNRTQNSKINCSEVLHFDSRFQCGNLYCVYHKVDTNEYHLFLQNDTNSYGYNQWFYFSITNAQPSTQYNFVIVNLKKKHSFFRQGYQPILFSLKKYQGNGNKNGWYRSGYNIDYQQSHIVTSKFFKFYKLSFSLNFRDQNDYFLVAANLPYSFTRLSNFIERFSKMFKISNDNQGDNIANVRISHLGRTFCGNNLPEIKISPYQQQTTKKSPSKNKKKNTQNQKKMIVFLARQHPGQTVSSYLMESILTQIASFGVEAENSKQKEIKENIKFLIKNFTILIYPMINIDGVIYGNSRCDVSGMDLNRRWKNPSKIFHPQVFNIKNRLQNYSKKYEIVSCFDLHGHSKLFNVFCYSCKINPVSCRILPFLVSKQTKKFNFPSCTFGITRYKSTTARAAIFKIIRNENVLTIQSSYFGYVQNKQQSTESSGQLKSSNKNKVIKYFQPKDFEQLAVSLLKGLQIFLNKAQEKKCFEIEKQIRTNLRQIQNYERENHEGGQDSGSQSDPEGDQIEFQVKIKTILGREFIQEASSFLPAEEEQNIQIPTIEQPSSANLLSPQKSIQKLSSQQKELQMNQQMTSSVEPNQKANKIRITKMKPQQQQQEGKTKKNLSSKYKIKNDPGIVQLNTKALRSQVKKQKKSISLYEKIKDTITFQKDKKPFSTFLQNSFQRSERLYSQNHQRSMFGGNKNNSEMKINDQSRIQVQTQSQIPKFYDDLIIYSAQSKDLLKMQKNNLLESISSNHPSIFTDSQFFIKFKKFIPSQQMQSFNRKEKLSFLQESIYKDDQKEILHTLMQNKRKLQRQKIKRQQQKSSTIGQRYSIKNGRHKNVWDEEMQAQQRLMKGYGLSEGRKRQQIVDFRRFKDRQKAKLQMRQTNQVHIKFIKKEGKN